MANDIRFSVVRPGGDRVHHIDEADIGVVLSRLPREVYRDLRAVHFNDRSRGAKVLGYVNRGRREIAMCALPPRVSFTRALNRGQTPEQFGAKRGTQWPVTAVRRFLLHDVFLHELGHLQIVHHKAASARRKFAMEPKAQEFAIQWCKQLWSQSFNHPDPVHNPPTDEEKADSHPALTASIQRVQQHPDDTDAYQELGKAYRNAGMMEESKSAFEKSATLDAQDPWSRCFLGNWYYTNRDYEAAIMWFARAIELQSDYAVFHWCLAEAYEKDGKVELADALYHKAVQVEPNDKRARAKLKSWKDRKLAIMVT